MSEPYPVMQGGAPDDAPIACGEVDCSHLSGHTIVAGYGLPGRAAAEQLRKRGVPHCVVELNASTVDRCAKVGTPIIEGDCRIEQTLRRAGILGAASILILIPNERDALQAAIAVRAANPTIKILMRCNYTSVGIEARARGVDEVIVEEQVVADEIVRRLSP